MVPAELSYGVSRPQRETGRLVLILGAAVLLGLCELNVVLVVPIRALLDIAVAGPSRTLGTQEANVTWTAIRSVAVVCHTNKGARASHR